MKTLSGQIQQWLGAKPQDSGGRTQEILAGRLPSQNSNDYIGEAAYSTLVGGKPVSSQDVADERLSGYLGKLSDIKKLQTNSGGSTGELIDRYMEATGADFPSALQAIQTGFRQNMLLGPDGSLQVIPGAAAGKATLSEADKTGAQRAELAYAGPIAEASAIGKATGEIGGSMAKKAMNSGPILDLINRAKTELPYATGGGIQNIGAKGKQFFGYSDRSTQADSALDAISAGLLNTVPRMEGPQSDADRLLYERAAGDVGNRSKPIGDRIAALNLIQELNLKYQQDYSNPQNPGMSLPGAQQIPGLGGVTNQDIMQGVIRVNTPEEARSLPPGTTFMTPDGRTKVKQ